jgi:endonuclease/exonuclease/phosphatase family metal-dependent hydrolase
LSVLNLLVELLQSIGDQAGIITSWLALQVNLNRAPVMAGLFTLAWRATLVAEPPGQMAYQLEPAAPALAVHEQITVVSANLWHDWPRHRDMVERLEAFASLVEAEGADILLLQEVARTPDLLVDEWLAKRLGMAYVYARANGHQRGIGFEEGVAIFSRYPLHAPEVRQLNNPANPFVSRVALRATIELPTGGLEAFSVHLGIGSKANVQQLSQLQSWIVEVEGEHPVVVGGDFNASESSPQMVALQNIWTDVYRVVDTQTSGNTHTLYWPWGTPIRQHRLDYIFLQKGERPYQILDARHLETFGIAHSDHRVVLIRFKPMI